MRPVSSAAEASQSWFARLAYVALALVVVISLWSKFRGETPRELSEAEILAQAPSPFSDAPPPEPLVANPNHRRMIRWCEVHAILARRCQRCHQSPTQLGAPFPLVQYPDIRAEYPPGSGQLVLDRIPRVIRYGIMPPVTLPLEPPVEELERGEIDALLVWFEEGALPFGGEACAPGAASR